MMNGQEPSYAEIDQVYTNTGQWVAPPPPEADLGSAGDLFVACNRSYPLRGPDDSYTWIELRDGGLVATVRSMFPSASSLYDRKPGIDCRDLYVQRHELIAAMDDVDSEDQQKQPHLREAIKQLLDYVDSKFAYVDKKIATFPRDHIAWNLLWSLVRIGDDLESSHDVTGEPVALTLDSWGYVTESMGKAFVMRCHYHQWAGTSFHRISITRKIMEFTNLMPISALPTKPLAAERRKFLDARGRQYLRYAKQAHADYSGFFFTRAFSGASRLLGDGQVVIDVKSFRRSNPSLDVWADDVTDRRQSSTYNHTNAGNTKPDHDFSPERAYLLPPTIHGFSLRAKRWGEFLVNKLSDICWQDRSFEHLVIPDSYRRIVRALVTVHAGELKSKLLTDVVEGKGNGLIMAFHGTPGTGKTLTAEAVAEHLRKPLYMVSAAELGTNVTTLEKQLKDVLELATLWNAVLLIDEADIFLEKRSMQQMERNALVGIFLRMLEYFSGVLILTTNSIDRFDDAFLSRFAVVLKFDELDQASRRTLWLRFLAKAGCNIENYDVDRLASVRLNGRDIKHTISTAQAVALVQEEELAMSHFEEVLAVAKSTLSFGSQ